MVVYIFPVDVGKVGRREIDAAECDRKIRSLGLRTMSYDPTYREEARKVKRLQPDGREVDEGDSIIIVDPELGFKAEDIVDDFSFGNGVTIGGVMLKDGRFVPCGFMVLSHVDKANADRFIPQLKNVFMGLI
ncbi:MAG: hypothetical protein QXJ07_06425 [Candidatus Bathyarchaeia archaeon]